MNYSRTYTIVGPKTTDSMQRTAFFISDRTGITAEMLGHSVLTQFRNVHFKQITIPYIDSSLLAEEALQRIEEARVADGGRPIIFSTIVEPTMRAVIARADALLLDCFQMFAEPIERELGILAEPVVGLTHGIVNPVEYHERMEIINFTLSHDDGMSMREISHADLILVGVSRCGKTPTSLYLALQFGIRAANYPLLPEDLEKARLPELLEPLRKRLYGLTINPDRLHQIRTERRPGSSYASIDNCRSEVSQAERLMRAEGIPYLDTSTTSIEEISTTIMAKAGLKRRIY